MRVGECPFTFLTPKEQQICCEECDKLQPYNEQQFVDKNRLERAGFTIYFVKIILLKSDNCALALRKWLFCAAKPTLLPYKTAAFGMQNNRFYNALIAR